MGITTEQLIKAMQATASPKPVPVETPKWGTIYVRQQLVADIDQQNSSDNASASEEVKKKLVTLGAIRAMCDEEGNLLFDEKNPEHVALVSSQPWGLLQKIVSKVNATEDEVADPTGNAVRDAS